MDEEKKVNDLSNRKKQIEEDYEDWEADYIFINKGDYKGLLKLREYMVKENPRDINSLWRLGEAYILNKEYEKAIEFLAPLHIKNPENEDIEYSILDALFALERTEKDFNWVRMPKIIRLSLEISDYFYEVLKGKRKARTIDDLYCELMIKGYLIFSEEDLLNYLINDGRFEINKDSNIYGSLIKVLRKK